MKKWFDEEYEWEIEVIGFNKDNDETVRFFVSDYGGGQKRRKLDKYRRRQ